MEVLIIGGTRNVGHLSTLELLRNGHQVTVFNRGITPDELPAVVQRLHGDRRDSGSLRKALDGRSFDVVIDMALYNAGEARSITELLHGRIGQYIFLSTGQVYLVREESPRPFGEHVSENPIVPPPVSGTRDHDEWLYGVEKSKAEDILTAAWKSNGFPATILRLPMVNSERDHFHRVYGYLKRLQDGGPILLPQGKHLPLRHVYAADVVQAICKVAEIGAGKGRIYNISQDETISIENFLAMLAEIARCKLRLTYADRLLLERFDLFPDCSPFSDPWMSELDNKRSKRELGMAYTPLHAYLQKLVAYYEKHPYSPSGYQRRSQEIELASHLEAD